MSFLEKNTPINLYKLNKLFYKKIKINNDDIICIKQN